ncbi:MAG: phage repressor protein/antirepressor Ant [Clostridia bacterium]|nr:phage repressor protein/antirepressor Ant [Clostridia bacterium]
MNINNNLQIFKNERFGEIQIIQENNKYEFEATGIAKILGYSNPHKAIIDHCKKDGLTKREVIDRLGRKQEKNFISEGNLYRLITHSKLPEAEKFEKWVFDEILPSIRKTGGYIAGEENLSEDELIAKALVMVNKKLELKEKQLQEQKPKVLFANSVEASKTSILIGELAKMIKQNGHDIGQNRLFEWLRNNGYLISRKGTDYNMPTQKAMNLGLFEIKETTISHSDGHVSISKTAKVTGKGQVYFVNKFLN